MKKILIVCTGNTCRSLMAEYLMRQLLEKEEWTKSIEVVSAGVSASSLAKPTENALRVLKEIGIEPGGHQPQQLRRGLVDEADLILVMEKIHRDWILQDYPSSREKVYLLNEFAGLREEEIPDPIGCSYEAYETCLNVIKSALIRVIERLAERRI